MPEPNEKERLKQHENRMVGEMLDSQGWEIFLKRLIYPAVATEVQSSFNHALRREHEDASSSAACAEAISQVVARTYKQVDRAMPPDLRNIMKGQNVE